MFSSKFMEQVRTTARLRHLSQKTEKAYLQQIKRLGTRYSLSLFHFSLTQLSTTLSPVCIVPVASTIA